MDLEAEADSAALVRPAPPPPERGGVKVMVDRRLKTALEGYCVLRNKYLAEVVSDALVAHLGLPPETIKVSRRAERTGPPPPPRAPPPPPGGRRRVRVRVPVISQCRSCGEDFDNTIRRGRPRFVNCPKHRGQYKASRSAICPACGDSFTLAPGQHRSGFNVYGRRWKARCPPCWELMKRERLARLERASRAPPVKDPWSWACPCGAGNTTGNARTSGPATLAARGHAQRTGHPIEQIRIQRQTSRPSTP